MVDNVTIPAAGTGTTTPSVATDDVAGQHYQRVKISDGVADSGVHLLIPAEDAASAGGDTGLTAMGIRTDTPVAGGLVSADADYLPLRTDNMGKVWVAGAYKEDEPSADADRGIVNLAVRTDAPASGAGVSADGDHAFVRVDSFGKIWVAGAYPEDQASANLDPVQVAGAKRLVTPANSSGTDGDYEPLTISVGKLWVTGAYPEDTASADLDPVMVAGARRTATPANTSGADLDYEPLQINAGLLWVHPVGDFVTVSTSVTRPANTTTYAVNDAIADATPTAGGFTLTSAARVSGGSGIITDMWVTFDDDAATPLQGEVFLFDQSVTAITDNAAFAITDAEARTCLGIIPFALQDIGNQGAAHVQNLDIGFTCVGTANLRFLMRAKNAYVPTANSGVIQVRVKIIQTN